jgi:hypothetical protein
MSLLANLVLPPWLNFKFVAMWLMGLALLGLLWSWNERGHEVQRLADFQSGVVTAISNATVKPDKNGHINLLKPGQVVEAINGLQSSYSSAKTQLVYIDKQSKANKTRADEADRKLTDQMQIFNKEYSVANQKIQALMARPAVKPENTCKVIEDDTNSAWDGWK